MGIRQYGNQYAPVPAIGIKSATVCEVAGCIIDRSGGPGIWVYTGKDSSPREMPLLRTLIHHNKVTSSCLITNDWGGIESWHGGPTYIYNNVSANVVGPRTAIFEMKKKFPDNSRIDYHYKEWACNAYSYYLDHGFKNYLFNNIAYGYTNDDNYDIRNRAAGVMVRGFMNHWFNNSFHNFMHGISGSPGTYNYILGNIFSSIDEKCLIKMQKEIIL